MASSTTSSLTIRALQEIIGTARSTSDACGYPSGPVGTMPPVPSTFKVNCCIPSPPPIDTILHTLGMHPALIVKISTAYLEFALRLRTTTEANLRRTIFVCQDINTRFHLPSYDGSAVIAAASEFYLRTLRQMTSTAVALFNQQIGSTGMYRTFGIPVGLSIPCHSLGAKQAMRGRKLANEHRLMGVKENSGIKRVKTDVQRASRGVQDPISDECGGCVRAVSLVDASISSGGGSLYPIYKTPQMPEFGKRMGGGESPAGSFPSPYVHIPVNPSNGFLSSSNCFFPDRQSRLRPQAALSCDVVDFPTDIVTKLGHLNIARTQKFASNAAESSAFSLKQGDIIPRRFGSSSPTPHSRINSDVSANISLQSAVQLSSKHCRRKVASLPRRGQTIRADSDRSCGLDVMPSPSAPRPLSASSPSDTSLCAPSDIFTSPSESGAVPVSRDPPQTRRRKVAPLPRRQPSKFPSNSISTQLPPSWSSPCPSRCSSVISRTPSLLSLSSSRSRSPSPDDDDLSTPPPSPSHSSHFLTSSPISNGPYSAHITTGALPREACSPNVPDVPSQAVELSARLFTSQC